MTILKQSLIAMRKKNFSEDFLDLQIHQKLLQAHPTKLFTHEACKKIAKLA